jgi:serine/threonine-protein kinase
MTDLLGNRYELGILLGSGGMARVVEGYDRLLARRVAVKLLHDELLADTRLRERFLLEARTAAGFSHPNAVTIYDTGREGRRPFIVMELVEGRTLAEELSRDGRLDERTAVGIAAQVLDALAAAHHQGLVHRDVKPSNIMLADAHARTDADDSIPLVKLTDFGIARITSADPGLTATGQVMGTPKYLAPELLDGSPATPRSDVYAAGLVLYEMLAGVPPFDGDNAIAVALAHRDQEPTPLARHRRGLTPAVVAVVNHAMQKDPGRRYANADQMRAALLAHTVTSKAGSARATRAAVVTQPSGASPPLADDAILDRQPPRRRSASWAILALAGLLALLGLLAFSAARNAQLLPSSPTADSSDSSGESTGATDRITGDEPSAATEERGDGDAGAGGENEPDARATERPSDAEPDRGAGAGQDPGQDAGQDPGTDPRPDPGTDPGQDPGTEPGRPPGTESGQDPDQRGTEPGGAPAPAGNEPPAPDVPTPVPAG